MQIEATTIAHQDEQAVEAVRRGDAERYRELVERYERRVFAVAWSRLGDAALAEEATQEAFIRGYRHLALLSDGTKFSGWISSIARHAAIGLGLRHRRELNKRERWALEQPTMAEPAGEQSEACPPETLRQMLAELPAVHRECLVLFYLEGKSGIEAAASLGISEAALRVRLHRARAEMRERLEEHLGKSLERLRPTRSVVPAVMAVVLSPSVKAAGGSATILSVLAKVLPLKFVGVLFGFLTAVPTLVFAWWMERLEERNYVDAGGFRAQLHRKHSRRQMWGLGLGMMVATIVAVCVVFMVVRHQSAGLRFFYLVMGVVYLLWILASGRAHRFDRSRLQVTNFLFGLGVGVGALLAGLGVISPTGFALIFALCMFPAAFGLTDRPLRMDYNLFLRATQGMLGKPAELAEQQPSVQLDTSRLREFAGFLCARRLAMMFSRCPANIPMPLPGTDAVGVAVTQSRGEGLIVPMVPVNANWRGGLKAVRRPGSFLTLSPDATVSAHLSAKDEQELKGLLASSTQSHSELEARVAGAVENAWRCFREGNVTAAEQVLGQGTESKIFIKPTSRTWATRGWMIFTLAVATWMLAMALRSLLK